MQFRVERYDEVSSTNNIIKERIDAGESEGLAVCAKVQVSGYGRRGNFWASPEGGLYISILLRPNAPVEDLPTLPHVCAIAVRRAIASFLPPDEADSIKIKWPNDIVYMPASAPPSSTAASAAAMSAAAPVAPTASLAAISPASASTSASAPFRKICGISVEQRKDAICVGIGINVTKPKETPGSAQENPLQNTSGEPAKLKNIPIYLEDLVPTDTMVSMQVLETRLLEALDTVYSTWSTSSFSDLRDEYLNHFALEGFKARIDECGDKAIKCEVVGINERGNLEVIPFGETEIKTIAAGTVRAL